MKPTRDSYPIEREKFLSDVVEFLAKDERFIAAWLTGSFSRSEADLLSDTDMTVVVADTYSTSLCTKLDQVSAKTSPERYSLFSHLGVPALIHENNNNAP